MKKYYHNNDIRRADIIAVEKYGVPSIVLMENAGTNAETASLLPDVFVMREKEYRL